MKVMAKQETALCLAFLSGADSFPVCHVNGSP